MWQQPLSDAYLPTHSAIEGPQPAGGVVQLGLTQQGLVQRQQTGSCGSGAPSQLNSTSSGCFQHQAGGTGQVQPGQLLAQLQGPGDPSSGTALGDWDRLGQTWWGRGSDRALHLQQQRSDRQHNQAWPLGRVAQDAAVRQIPGRWQAAGFVQHTPANQAQALQQPTALLPSGNLFGAEGFTSPQARLSTDDWLPGLHPYYTAPAPGLQGSSNLLPTGHTWGSGCRTNGGSSTWVVPPQQAASTAAAYPQVYPTGSSTQANGPAQLSPSLDCPIDWALQAKRAQHAQYADLAAQQAQRRAHISSLVGSSPFQMAAADVNFGITGKGSGRMAGLAAKERALDLCGSLSAPAGLMDCLNLFPSDSNNLSPDSIRASWGHAMYPTHSAAFLSALHAGPAAPSASDVGAGLMQDCMGVGLQQVCWPAQQPQQAQQPAGRLKWEVFEEALSNMEGSSAIRAASAPEAATLADLSDVSPLMSPDISPGRSTNGRRSQSGGDQPRRRSGRKRIPVEHISAESLASGGYFDMPIQDAAKQLSVGLSVLKRICRSMGLARWPYRSRHSLRGLIQKTEAYLTDNTAHVANGSPKADVVQALQAHLKTLKGEAGQKIADDVRKYRQSIFKLNHKLKKSRAAAMSPVTQADDDSAPPQGTDDVRTG